MNHDPHGRLPRGLQPNDDVDVPARRRSFSCITRRSAMLGSAALPLAMLDAIRSRKQMLARQSIIAPVRLVIPAIGVDAEVEQIHIVDGVMDVPRDPWHVGWYSQLAFPGQGANVVMAGHKDWWNVGPVVFWDLGRLDRGNDLVIWSHRGDEIRYVVETTDQISATTAPAAYTANTGSERLTLITCSGTFDGSQYDSRLIVRALPA